MPVNSRGERVNTHNQKKQKAQAQALRKPKYSTGGGGTIGSGASMGGGAG